MLLKKVIGEDNDVTFVPSGPGYIVYDEIPMKIYQLNHKEHGTEIHIGKSMDRIFYFKGKIEGRIFNKYYYLNSKYHGIKMFMDNKHGMRDNDEYEYQIPKAIYNHGYLVSRY